MQIFILLRGHEGAGKSTFAAQKIVEFLRDYPDATIVHIDNDHDLTDENGVYQFDFELFSQAHQKNQLRQSAAFSLGKQEPKRHILVINANPNQKAKTCYKQLQQAQNAGFISHCYRLHGFYPNQHGISQAEVLQSYERLNANPVLGEVHIFN